MVDIRFSRAGFKVFHSAQFVVIVADRLKAAATRYFHAPVQLLSLHADGVLTCLNEAPPSAENLMTFQAASAGLKAILVTAHEAPAAAALLNDHKAHAPAQKVFMHRMPASRLLHDREVASVAGQTLAHCLDEQRQHATNNELTASRLRRKNDWLALNLEKARRMIRGVGYDTRYLTLELSPSDKTMGPGGTIDTTSFSQQLPCDVLGLAAISLHFREVAAPAEGEVHFRLYREVDKTLIIERSLSFQKVSAGGWLMVDLGDPCDIAIGDGVLEVTWDVRGQGDIPDVSMASMSADRFGDGTGQSVALRLYRGLADPLVDRQSASLPADYRTVSVPLSKMVEMAEDVHVPVTDGEQGVSDAQSVSVVDGWLQTHSAAGGFVGARLEAMLTERSRAVSVTIHLPREAAVPHRFCLLAMARGTTTSFETVLKELPAHWQDDPEANRARSDDQQWVSHILRPGSSKKIRLTLEGPSAFDAGDLFLLVLPEKANADYGWCRWQGLTIHEELSGNLAQLAPPDQAAGVPVMQRLVSMRFPELSGRLSYLNGDEALSKIANSLGFSPFLVSEDAGYLQTHPLENDMSGAIVEGVVPAGTVSLSCELETAHENAPAFRYFLITTLEEKGRSPDAVRALVEQLETEGFERNEGVDRERGLCWNSRVIKPGSIQTLQVEMPEPTSVIGDVGLVVLPCGGGIGFGWCRWYSIDISSLIVADNACKVEATR